MSGPSLSVVSDLDDMFVPYISGFLVDRWIQVSADLLAVAIVLIFQIQIENCWTCCRRWWSAAATEGNRVAAGAGITGALSALRLFGGQN